VFVKIVYNLVLFCVSVQVCKNIHLGLEK